MSSSFLAFLAFLSSLLPNESKPKSRPGSGSGDRPLVCSSIVSDSFLPAFLLSFLPNEPLLKSNSISASGATVAAKFSTFSVSFLPFFFSFLPSVAQAVSGSGSGSGAATTAGSSTSVILLPFFPLFLLPNPPHSSAACSVDKFTVAAVCDGAGTSSSPFLPFFFFAEVSPQAFHKSPAAGSGSASAVPIVFGSWSLEISSKPPFFFPFFSFFPAAVEVPQCSLPSTLSPSAFSSSTPSLSAPKLKESKPLEVVFFFWFFLFPPNDQVLLSVVSAAESCVALAKESAISVVAVSAPLKFQLLPVFQGPPPPQPLNEPKPPLSFVSV